MRNELDVLRRRAAARGWHQADPDTWTAAGPDGTERAVVRVVPGGFEARLIRRRAGDEPGSEAQPSHGPQFFEVSDEALDYAEANLGGDAPESRDGDPARHPGPDAGSGLGATERATSGERVLDPDLEPQEPGVNAARAAARLERHNEPSRSPVDPREPRRESPPDTGR